MNNPADALNPSVSKEKRPIIFIADSEASRTRPLAEYLAGRDFSVSTLHESDSAVEQIVTHLPDAVVLNTDLPPAGGYEVCRSVRPYYSGAILIQGRDPDEAAQLLAFERGADDYIILPASPVLIATRIDSHLQRLQGWQGRTAQRRIQVGGLSVDAARREVLLKGEPIHLTTTQFDLLWYLMKRTGRAVSRDQLYEALYHAEYNGYDRSVDIQISRIRQQLGDHSENPTYLKTIRGVGYQFVNPD